MAGWMTPMVQFLNLWVIRIVVLSSFAVHLVLILFAGIRRHKAFGWRTILLWLAYQGGGWAATSALGNLTLGRTLREQQLVTFWAPFLLLHLGGPDNISAYSLEDNVLSARQIVNVAAQVAGATYGLYKHIIIGSDGALLWASVILFFFGVCKYVEKALALWRGDFGSIRSSIKKPSCGFIDRVGLTKALDNERALLVAHGLFNISKGAFVDYSVKDLVEEGDINREVFSYGWELCKVVEMELSLMYDILYTKAAVVHTWFGYGIRVASPLATATAFLLFCLYNKDGQRRGDVVITYILLVATFLLDLIWLLTALGSTWSYAFLNDRPRCTGSGRWLWQRFRRFIVSLHTCRLLAKEPTSYRSWPGSIGQYNLLQECTHDTTSQYRALAKKVGLEDRWMEYQFHYLGGLDILPDIKDELFEKIWIFLKSAYPRKKHDKKDEKKDEKSDDKREDEKDEKKKKEEKKPDIKEGIVRERRKLELALKFCPEFQEDMLIWHIATDVFLWCRDQNAACTPQRGEGDQGASMRLSEKYVKAIKALSDYMVFLVAVRPNMLPGLKLRSTYEATHEALDTIWRSTLQNKRESSQSSRDVHESSSSSKIREEELATILRNMELARSKQKPRNRSLLYDSSIVLSDGTKLAEELLKIAKNGDVRDELSFEILHFLPDLFDIKRISGTIDMQKLLELIFKAWVRMLIFVSVRCSRDSHAKQLSRGGELTTIVWILVEHAAIFGIDKWRYQCDGTDKNAAQ